MKKILKYLAIPAALACLLASCSDLSDIEKRVESLESRVQALETQIGILNTNVAAVQKLAEGGTISSVEEKDGVYTITLSNGKKIVLKQGSTGIANAPVVSIDADGYWTVDYGNGPEHILVNGEKVKAVGKDGLTPIFGVDTQGYWTVSYDGKTFTQVKDANGNPVKAIPEGSSDDKWFNNVSVDGDKLVVVLKDGSTYSLPIVKDFKCAIQNAESEIVFNYGETKSFTVEMVGVATAMVTAPEGWAAVLDETTLSVTAPAQTKAVLADSKTDVCILAISNSGFSTISKVKVSLDDTPVVTGPAATVTFKSSEACNVVSFEVKLANASAFYYLFQKSAETAPDAAAMTTKGEKWNVSTQAIGPTTLNSINCEPETSYTLYILPVDGEVQGAIASASGTTPAATGLYAKYWNGEELTIGGVTVSKTTHPTAYYISNAMSIQFISKPGVYFVEPDATDVEINSGIQNVIVVSNGSSRASVRRTSQLVIKATEFEDAFIMSNINFTTGLNTGNMLGVNGDDAKTFVFENIYFENCGFEVPKDMNFMYSTYNIGSFGMVDCDIKLHATTSEKNILSTNTNNDVTYALCFRNNIIYCTDGDVTGYQVFKNINATVSSVELSSNTFARVYVKASYGLISAKHCGTADVKKNLFYTPDYETLVGAAYTGIIYATDTNKSSVGAETAAANSAGFTFTSNLAYYSTTLPSKRMKCSYYANDGGGQLYNKYLADDYPFATADFTNGVFTTTETYASYGAKR